MTSRAIELAKECGAITYLEILEIDDEFIEAFYAAARNDGLKRAAEICDERAPKHSLYLDEHRIAANVLHAAEGAIRKEIQNAK